MPPLSAVPPARVKREGLDRSAAIAVAIAAATAALNLADLLFLDYYGPVLALTWVLGLFAAVGLVLTLRRPGHPVGWLFLLTGAGFALISFLGPYSFQALVGAPGTLPAGEIAAELGFLWMPTLGSALFAVMLFPNGRPLSRRWAVGMIAVGAVFVAAFVCVLLAPAPNIVRRITEGTGEHAGDTTVPNPFGVSGPLGDALLALSGPLLAGATFSSLALTVAVVFVRFRRSSGVERQQLKWFSYGAAISSVLLILAPIFPEGIVRNIALLAGVLAFGLIPVGAGIAILRYRLYDIDLLINRTLVYAAVTTTLAATFFGALVVIQALLRPLTAGSELAVAIATLGSFALFQPARRAIQNVVDRRFNRNKYDAQRTLDAFSVRLRDEVDLDAVRADLIDAVQRTVQPASASVWLRERAR